MDPFKKKGFFFYSKVVLVPKTFTKGNESAENNTSLWALNVVVVSTYVCSSPPWLFKKILNIKRDYQKINMGKNNAMQ